MMAKRTTPSLPRQGARRVRIPCPRGATRATLAKILGVALHPAPSVAVSR